MSWVEELGPEDEVKVEIIYPQFYVDYNISTIKKYSAAIASLCKGAALLGESEIEMDVRGMTVLQIITIEEAMRAFGVEMMHELLRDERGERFMHIYADISQLKNLLEELEDFDKFGNESL